MPEATSDPITEADLEELDRALHRKRGPVRVDLRPVDGVGVFLRIERQRPEEVSVRLTPNLYFPVAVQAAARRNLDRLGWSLEGRTPERLFPGGSEDIVPFCADTLTTLGVEDMLTYVGDYAVDHVPECSHAITFWDWKEDPPFDDFNRACTALLASGADSIVFNDADTGGDTYAIVIAERELSPDESDAAWGVYLEEIPNAGGELVVLERHADTGHLVRVL